MDDVVKSLSARMASATAGKSEESRSREEAAAAPEGGEPGAGSSQEGAPAIAAGKSAQRPSREEAEAAVRTLLRWAGDNPDREGLVETPKRVVKAYEQFYAGYRQDPREILDRVFEEVEGYGDIVLVRDIDFHTHCEHHMVPFFGHAHIAYYPSNGVIGLSKLARLVDIFARRLQTQETMTVQIAEALDETLKPRGVAVMLEAEHMCMSMRGIQKIGASTITTQFTGVFKEEPAEQVRFLTLVRQGQG